MLRDYECPEQYWVKFATTLLRGSALQWWRTTLRMLAPNDEVVAWDQFETAFYDKYFPRSVRESKETQFLSLVQASMFVADYDTQFTALSRFCPRMVSTEEDRARHFLRGLNDDIHAMLITHNITSYKDVLEKAQLAEMHLSERRKNNKGGAPYWGRSESVRGFSSSSSGGSKTSCFSKIKNWFKGKKGQSSSGSQQYSGGSVDFGRRSMSVASNQQSQMVQKRKSVSGPPSGSSMSSSDASVNFSSRNVQCFRCGEWGHIVSNYSQRRSSVAQESRERAHVQGRVYAVTKQDAAQASNAVVEGKKLINSEGS
ncbi:hypothetical protein Dimus_038980 [Dionaea muscipula]